MSTREREMQELRERIAALRRSLAGDDESDAAGELADYDQHQADSATEMTDREHALGLAEDLAERLRLLERGEDPDVRPGVVVPTDPDDTSTPLDEPAPREDLSAIPMATEHADVVADPQEDDDLPDLDMPGAVYPTEGGPPTVGRPEPDDGVLQDYRPD